ncbi:MAG: cupin domain-containing protein, partial [Nitrospinae bacterium]|nr:cupin domain-containing protein [Nitrospinota bacterium]
KMSRPHYHPNEEQFLFILEGRQWMIVGDEEGLVVAGDLVHIPRGAKHGGVIIDEVRMFTAKSPSGDGSLDQDHNDAEDAEAIVRRLEEKLREFS